MVINIKRIHVDIFDTSNSNFKKDIMLCKFVSGFDVGVVDNYVPDSRVRVNYVEI